MFTKTWSTSRREYGLTLERDVKITMSDSITIDADVFRPDAPGKFPAILGVHPYNKELQTAPVMPTGINRVNACYEAGDPNFYVRRGYVQVVANVRGSGRSQGTYAHYGPREVQDTAEIIEWIAAQPWCDGNVGMFGVSYFSIVQQQVAALKPPHLRAIFAPFGYTDFYRDKFYHGGILSHSFMQTWATHIDNIRVESWYRAHYGEERFNAAIKEVLEDEDIRAVPYLVESLNYPERSGNALITDVLLNPLDGEYYRERNVDYGAHINVPAYHGACWGIYGLHLPGAFRSWDCWEGPKKMIIGPPIYLDRPVYQYQYESLRWFDYWLKGIDTKIMEEPPIRVFVTGTGRWKHTTEWPLPETRWIPFYLHSGGLLSEHEFWPNEGYTTFEDSHFNRNSVTFLSPPLVESTEIIGPIVLNLYGSTTATEVFWFASLLHIDAKGNETLLTRGWLRGSQRQTDPDRSKPWQPFHLHAARDPLVPGEIYAFNIEMRPYGILLAPGERIGVRVKCVDDEKPADALHSIAAGHLWKQGTSRVTVYHNAEYPSHLLLPVTEGNVIETYMSGGNLSATLFPYRNYSWSV
jgi:predicted acyl esterase